MHTTMQELSYVVSPWGLVVAYGSLGVWDDVVVGLEDGLHGFFSRV